MDEPRLARLIYDMTILLKKYETELEAYYRVYAVVENEARKMGSTLNLHETLESIVSSPALMKGADDMYSSLDMLARSMTLENLDSAAFAIQRIQSQRGVVKVSLPQTDPKGPIQ